MGRGEASSFLVGREERSFIPPDTVRRERNEHKRVFQEVHTQILKLHQDKDRGRAKGEEFVALTHQWLDLLEVARVSEVDQMAGLMVISDHLAYKTSTLYPSGKEMVSVEDDSYRNSIFRLLKTDELYEDIHPTVLPNLENMLTEKVRRSLAEEVSQKAHTLLEEAKIDLGKVLLLFTPTGEQTAHICRNNYEAICGHNLGEGIESVSSPSQLSDQACPECFSQWGEGKKGVWVRVQTHGDTQWNFSSLSMSAASEQLAKQIYEVEHVSELDQIPDYVRGGWLAKHMTELVGKVEKSGHTLKNEGEFQLGVLEWRSAGNERAKRSAIKKIRESVQRCE